jgi:malonyl-CoA O-methyltransferase
MGKASRADMIKSINSEFGEHAKEYDAYNIIQKIVSRALVRELDFEPKRILELGCGSGQVLKNIDFAFEYYKAIDFSQSMCHLHPKAKNVEVCCFDFDSKECRDNIKEQYYDIVLSSSALQWSKDIEAIVGYLQEVSPRISFVLFTSNTFKTIFKITNQNSPILNIDTIKDACSKYYDCQFEILQYNLEFENKKKMFDYIKNSGVGGGNTTLSFKEAKKLYKEYPYNYLEFEVVFIKGKRKEGIC